MENASSSLYMTIRPIDDEDMSNDQELASDEEADR